MNYCRTGYTYSMATGEYIGQETVYLEKATGTYPCAGNVVFKRPPECGEHECAVWLEKRQEWDVVPDFRGCAWYNADGTLGGVIEELGKTDRITQEPPILQYNETLDFVNGEWVKRPKDGWTADKVTGELREMTRLERIYAGLDELPADSKIVDGEIVDKTPDDLFDEGAITAEEYNQMQIELREREYRRTTDKLGLMVLRGEATMEEWQTAIAEVKAKYPKKETAE